MSHCPDLHIHTTFSDGTCTPEEIVSAASEAHSGGIAICDHDTAQGALCAEPLARRRGLPFIAGAEIDSMLMGRDAHLLCYGADFSDPALSSVMRTARAALDGMSDRLIDAMHMDADEYAAFTPDPRLGGWKLLQYFKFKKLTFGLKDALPYYGTYGITYESAGFPSAEEVIAAIHGAGGCAVLAHAGATFGTDALRGLEAAAALGIDGAECHCPKHSPELARALSDFCRQKKLCITCGSDFHGDFGSARLGQGCVPAAALCLDHPAFHAFKGALSCK